MSDPDTELIIQRGLFFEERREDVRYEHAPGRTVGESGNIFFSTLTMNAAAIHLDAIAAAHGEFGRPLVNSLFTLATVVGLRVGQMTQGTTVANLGFGAVESPAPVFVGDTIRASTIDVSKRLPRGRPDCGVVEFRHESRNGDGTIVAIANRHALRKRIPGRSAP